MKRAGFTQWDRNFSVLSERTDFLIRGIIGLEDKDSFQADRVLFLKDKKYVRKCLDLLQQFKPSGPLSMGVVLDQKLSKQLEKDESNPLKSLSEHFAWVASTEQMELCLSEASRYFYQQRWGGANDVIDGRQMGTADVHPSAWIAQGAFIGEGVKIAEQVKIHPGVVVMAGCEIGAGCVIFPNVTLYYDVKLGSNVRIHAGSVIGADGFGYNYKDGKHLKVWHLGGVIIGNDVEIGANSNVDGGTFSATRIGDGTKIDNHVQIGHNCKLGKGVLICGHVAIGGSTVIGDYCVFGGKSGSGDNINLGPGCQVAGGALVNCDWPAQTVLGGHPARPLKEWMRGLATLRKLSLTDKN